MKIEYAPNPDRGITRLMYVGDDAPLVSRNPCTYVKIGIAALIAYGLYRMATKR